MATTNWIGNANATKQIDTITVAGTWAAADTVTLTINNKGLVVTIGADTTTAQVAQAIRDAWNATSRLDSEGATDATSNFGGQECGEFAEVTASIDADATSVVLLTANRAGVPFTLSVTEATAGSGTATEATAQAATGPWHWNSADNWSGGSTPVSDDVVVFRDSDVSCLYGLPNSSLEVTFNVYQSFTGSIGLPVVNRQNQSKPYSEYRQRYVRLNDAGTGTDIAHRFGLGQSGAGSPLINLKHTTVKCSPVIFNTGTPQIPGTKALNICCTVNTSTINILAGSVDFSSQDGGTAAFVGVSQTGGDSQAINGIHTSSAVVNISGGTALISGAGAIGTIGVQGGTLRLENQSGTITTLSVFAGGTVDYASPATITTLGVWGTFDARSGAGAFTVTNGTLYPGARFFDPFRRMAIGSAFAITFNPSADLLFGAGGQANFTITYI